MDEEALDEQTPSEAIRQFRDALDNLGKFLHHEGALLTGWALVCEWMDADGDVWMSSHADSGTPPWRAFGLMAYAQKQEDLLVPLGNIADDQIE